MRLRGVDRLPAAETRLRRAWDALTETLAWVAGTGVQVVDGVLALVLDEPSGLTQSATGVKVKKDAVAGNLIVITADGVKVTLPFTAKGDILVYNGTAIAVLPVGTDGQVLTADSTAPTGLKWA